MRVDDLEIMDEAIRNSGSGEDFDEMLLRATKKHLPRKYHRQFSVMLEEILKEADDLSVSNRSAAQSLARKLRPAPGKAETANEALVRVPERPPASAPVEPGGALTAPPVPPPKVKPRPVPGAEGPISEPAEEANEEGEPSEGSVEKLPEEQKILDLGGTHPESLPPEIKDKLRKLVKAQKRKQEWAEGAPEEEPAPGLFFKGQQRAPPFVPLGKPPKKEENPGAPVEKPAADRDEEDLEKD